MEARSASLRHREAFGFGLQGRQGGPCSGSSRPANSPRQRQNYLIRLRFAVLSAFDGRSTSMDCYLSKIRVELTPLGWLYMTETSLRASTKCSNKRKQAEQARRAGMALSLAIFGIEKQLPRSGAMFTDIENTLRPME